MFEDNFRKNIEFSLKMPRHFANDKISKKRLNHADISHFGQKILYLITRNEILINLIFNII